VIKLEGEGVKRENDLNLPEGGTSKKKKQQKKIK
jgi:hypothetical protein